MLTTDPRTRRPVPIPVVDWSTADMVIVQEALLDALEGVGDVSRVHVERGDVGLHVRRPMTAAEAAALPRRGDEPVFPIERAR